MTVSGEMLLGEPMQLITACVPGMALIRPSASNTSLGSIGDE
ncbi:hypothetical protein MKX50_24865 [Paenibacillus sp. FSL W8-0186]